MAELILGDVAPSDRLEAVVNFSRTTPRHDLGAMRVGTALDLSTQCGGRRTRVLEREHGVAADRELACLATALEAVAQRPRLHAGWLHDEVEPITIQNFLTRGGWFPGPDIERS